MLALDMSTYIKLQPDSSSVVPMYKGREHKIYDSNICIVA